jgi:GNAT superfamily N-acetyltransferase
MYNIELIKPQNINVIIPFLQLLDANLTENDLKTRLQVMLANNYQCIGVYDEDRLVGISGLWIIQKYYIEKYIEPDNVVIHPDYRGKGIGEILSKWIDEYAVEIGCVAANLNVYATNSNAIRFWLNQGYKIISFHLQKKLK